MPSTELNVTITNAQFHLVILAVLIIVAPPASSRWWWPAEAAIVVLSTLSGPIRVSILLPVAALSLWPAASAVHNRSHRASDRSRRRSDYTFTLSTIPSSPSGDRRVDSYGSLSPTAHLSGRHTSRRGGGEAPQASTACRATTLAAHGLHGGPSRGGLHRPSKPHGSFSRIQIAAVLIVGSRLTFLSCPHQQWYSDRGQPGWGTLLPDGASGVGGDAGLGCHPPALAAPHDGASGIDRGMHAERLQ